MPVLYLAEWDAGSLILRKVTRVLHSELVA